MRVLGLLLLVILPLSSSFSVQPTTRRSSSALNAVHKPTAINNILSVLDLPIAERQENAKLISSGSSISKLWTKETWHRHRSRSRYMRNVISWPWSVIFRGLLPIMSIFAVWCTFVWSREIRFSPSALSFLASPLSLLLAFRVNNAVNRFHTARTQWGQLVLQSRTFASIFAAVDPDFQSRERAARLLVAFSWSVKQLVNYEESDEVVSKLLPAHDAAIINKRRKPALMILTLLRREVNSLNLKIPDALALSECVAQLGQTVGGMERLMTTPLSAR